MIDRIKSLRARVLGLNVTNARLDDIQNRLDAQDASLRADIASRSADLLRQQAELSEALDALPLPSFMADIEALKDGQARMDASLADLAAQASTDAQAKAAQEAAAASAIPAPTQYRPGQAIRVAFIVQHPSIWPSWRSVWNAASKDPRFSVRVVLTPFIHPFSSEAMTYDEMKQCLLNEGVPFCTADYFDPALSQPHVVFIQNPYEDTRPAHLRIERLKAAGARVAYIPYGLELGGGAWNIGAQFDTALHRSAWRVFVRSERSRRMFGKYCLSGNSHVVVTGHPKFDDTDTLTEKAPRALVDRIAGRKVILWTPHFSVGDPPTWATFKTYGNFILSEMQRRTDLFLLMRPHPLFFKAMREHNAWDAEQEQDFRQKLNATENFSLDETADYRTAFSLADALMADVGSFLLEFLPTGKPLLYLHCDGGLGMNDDGEIVESLYAAYSQADITSFIDMVARGVDPRKQDRVAVMPEFLFGLGLKSTAGERICGHIHEALSAEIDWVCQPTGMQAERGQTLPPQGELAAQSLFAPAHASRRMAALESALSAFSIFNGALLIGSDDGALLSRFAAQAGRLAVHAEDYASGEAIRLAAANSHLDNVHILGQALRLLAPTEKYDLISCLDATSLIADDVAFLYIIEKLMLMTRPGGTLLLTEVLSTRHDQLQCAEPDDCRKFRSVEDFRTLVLRKGFVLKNEVLISEAQDKHLVNKLFVFELANNHRARPGSA